MDSFGPQLKKIREQRGITLDEVSMSTKIGVRFLHALEEEHFDLLPGGVFNKGFVRSYARTIGIDENQAIADYLNASGEAPPTKLVETEEQPAAPAKSPISISEFPWRMLATVLTLVIVVVTLVFVAIQLRKLNIARRNEISSISPTKSPSEAPTQNRAKLAAASQAPVRAPSTFTVKIKADDDSWLSITADGKEIMQDTLEMDEEKSVEAHSEIVIKAGNIGGLEFSFNGTKLPPQGDYGNVRTLTFDANGLQPADHTKTASSEQP
jgi:cytoskeleton protein RodZ